MFQSASALDFVKKDLVEFQSTMKNDTTKIATGVKEKISVSDFICKEVCFPTTHLLN